MGSVKLVKLKMVYGQGGCRVKKGNGRLDGKVSTTASLLIEARYKPLSKRVRCNYVKPALSDCSLPHCRLTTLDTCNSISVQFYQAVVCILCTAKHVLLLFPTCLQ